NYQPQPYPGRLLFFKAIDRNEINPPYPEKPWIEVSQGGLELHEIPGNHITMNYSPHVQILAEKVRPYLA
ncbi:MAG: hypothetical protein F6K32_19675, partial [Desertifilum sp. SIO1I2]|nr:hypothetical protein [Desertifilum sp. SIO1I2]